MVYSRINMAPPTAENAPGDTTVDPPYNHDHGIYRMRYNSRIVYQSDLQICTQLIRLSRFNDQLFLLLTLKNMSIATV